MSVQLEFEQSLKGRRKPYYGDPGRNAGASAERAPVDVRKEPVLPVPELAGRFKRFVTIL